MPRNKFAQWYGGLCEFDAESNTVVIWDINSVPTIAHKPAQLWKILQELAAQKHGFPKLEAAFNPRRAQGHKTTKEMVEEWLEHNEITQLKAQRRADLKPGKKARPELKPIKANLTIEDLGL